MSADVTFFDRPAPPPGEMDTSVVRAVTPGYVDALGVGLVRGRGLEARDRQGAPPVALVNASFAERFFAGRDPIEEKILLHASFGYDESEPRTIVGVVATCARARIRAGGAGGVGAAGSDGERLPDGPGAFPESFGGPSTNGASDCSRSRPQPAGSQCGTLASAVARNIGATRFYFLLLTVFAGLAVSLASIGLYGVVSYLVSTRRKEIGLRMALGADARDVVRLILMQGLRPTLVGVAAGVVGAFVSARLLQSMLYNVGPFDAAWPRCARALGRLAAYRFPPDHRRRFSTD